MDRDDDEHQDKIRRFEQAVHELIAEGHSLFDYYGLLDGAAERAGVDRQEVHPTRH